MTCDMWQGTLDMWQVRRDMWHGGAGGRWTFSQNVRSLSLMFWDRQCFKGIFTNECIFVASTILSKFYCVLWQNLYPRNLGNMNNLAFSNSAKYHKCLALLILIGLLVPQSWGSSIIYWSHSLLKKFPVYFLLLSANHSSKFKDTLPSEK